jgi:hypothetical protein
MLLLANALDAAYDFDRDRVTRFENLVTSR